MKNKLKIVLTSIILIAVNLTVIAQDKIIPEDQLPKEITKYLKVHFPNNYILQASIDKKLLSKSYDIILKDNIKLEFNSKNRIKEIDGNSALPKSVIPNKIIKYVESNFSDSSITDWELDDANQKVKLENGITLEFNMKGKFLRIDN